MPHSAEEQFSHLRSLIHARSFNDTTLGFLESLLVSKDVESATEVRSTLTQLLRSESLSIIHSIALKTLHQKLLILDFFVRAFAILGDVQSCLALRYEALVLRELKSATASCEWLQVSSVEWLNFVADAAHNGFHSVAEKACENALSCLGRGNNDVLKPATDTSSQNLSAIREITRLKNSAMASVASRSVQVQAVEYLKRKTKGQQKSDPLYKEERSLASTSFKNGIKKQNIRKFYEHRSLLQINDEN
ncbi:unnamed protein product [Lupinus luteus]|uniref:Pentatricopeptide repeat-containing protein n=1 Tax=Lupinus luteus TaxID=3873 RepID=A0AAV1YLZ3_LUPLU